MGKALEQRKQMLRAFGEQLGDGLEVELGRNSGSGPEATIGFSDCHERNCIICTLKLHFLFFHFDFKRFFCSLFHSIGIIINAWPLYF